MYEILKAIATKNNWVFTYARKDFQNLFDEAEQKNVPHIFLDPVEIGDNDDDANNVESKTYSGDFMILFSSDFDTVDYDKRYQDHIKPIIDGAMETIKEAIRCEQIVKFNLWRSIEVINAFDYNFDGVIVKYVLTIDE